MLPLHNLLLAFGLVMVNPCFITSDYLLQIVLTIFMIMGQVSGTNIQALTLTLLCQFIRHPPGTHFTEIKGVMNQGIGRINTHIQRSCNIFNCHSFVFTNQFQGSFFIPRGCGHSWMSGALCICHSCAAILVHFNPLIHDSMREFYPHIEHTRRDEFLFPSHLQPTKSV